MRGVSIRTAHCCQRANDYASRFSPRAMDRDRRRPRPSRRHQKTSTVRIVAEERGFDEWRSGNSFLALLCAPASLGRARARYSRQDLVAPLVASDLLGEVRAQTRESLDKVSNAALPGDFAAPMPWHVSGTYRWCCYSPVLDGHAIIGTATARNLRASASAARGYAHRL
jgi:hypothetical protein